MLIYREDEATPRPFYDYEMMYDESLKFKSWEVARATSAAPMYFQPFSKSGSHEYWDGGLCHNNPAWLARQEAGQIWPELSNLHPDVLLSVGSGYVATSKQKTDVKPASWWSHTVDMFRSLGGIQTIKILKTTLLQNLDSEHAWNDRFSEYTRNPETKYRYFRLNPQCKNTQLPELDDLAALRNGTLASIAQEYLDQAGLLIKTIARRLIATSFYFEADEPPEENENGRYYRGNDFMPVITMYSRCS